MDLIAWSDILVIVVVLVFTLIGFKTGFVLTLYRFVSMILSFWVALQLYPILSKFMIATPAFNWLKDSIVGPVSDKLGVLKTCTLQTGIEQLGLPSFMGGWIKENNPGIEGAKIVKDIADMIATTMAEIVLKIIAVFLVFIIAFLILLAVKGILKFLVKLPIIKQIDKLAGILIGAVTGMLITYLICAGIIIFGTSLSTGIQKDIDKSYVAKYFVKNNYIVNILSTNK